MISKLQDRADFHSGRCVLGLELTCTGPGNVPGQSCAGLWAAGPGTGQETALR